MKKQLIICSLLGLATATAMAQDTYLNDRATNTSDVIGTARYVGMGGAMGALGADTYNTFNSWYVLHYCRNANCRRNGKARRR